MDRYTKIVLTIIAVNLTLISIQQIVPRLVTDAWAQNVVSVRVVGGRLDYETDVSGGPTLKVCTNC